jgi:hypothetical protein
MTVTANPRPVVPAPVSQDPAALYRMLEDPALIGFRWEICDAIEQLTGVRPEVD